ncbi:hypothetical protein [Thiocapsa sp.]|uniref:hypothetical protein n=1 Tax=Thiocapsa sp. TaxID=2024551 RepID=UPI002B6D8F15|nr:hypothetical protein [Thiocapsa sp.]HSO83790.1 hypothetical protein [Thiocapsa sp.]
MQPALTLTEQERLCFMQALDAVAWAVVWQSNDQPGRQWQSLLRDLGNLLAVAAADHKFRAGAPGIAEKVNQIGNPRARLYFLRVIHDVYHSEFDSLAEVFFAEGQRIACRKGFLPVYNQLIDAIRLD